MLHVNEIDFMMVQNKSIVQNVEVLNRLEFKTDHRMVRLTLILKIKIRKQKSPKQLKILVNPLDSQKILEFNTTMKLSLKNDTKVDYKQFEKFLLKAGEIFQEDKNKHPILTSSVKEMIQKREDLRRKAQKDFTLTKQYIDQRRMTKNAIRRDVRN